MAKLSVGIVEDDELARKDLEVLLLNDGHKVRGFDKGENALPAFLKDPPDVLITDQDLGDGITGLDVAKVFKNAFPGRHIIMVSGHPPKEEQIVDVYLSKPLVPEKLLIELDGISKLQLA